jgi:hypothetical protein
MFPVLRFSYERGAYVLRVVGETRGPVLRKNRRRRQNTFRGADRRAGAVDPVLASRPIGNVRRIEPGDDVGRGAVTAKRAAAAVQPPPAPNRVPNTKRSRAAQTQATRRRRQGGRQQPPHPHR